MTGLSNALNLNVPVNSLLGGSGVSSATIDSPVFGPTSSGSPFQFLSSLGSIGQLLTSNGSSSLPSFQAGGALSGDIVQVQFFKNIGSSGNVNTNSTTYITTNLSGSITPTNSSNHILILGQLAMMTTAFTFQTSAGLQLWRNGSLLVDYGNSQEIGQTPPVSAVTQTYANSSTTFYYDAPATTSSTTYEYYFNQTGSGGRSYVFNQNAAVILLLIELAI